ncbi:MAG: VOC family protein [Ignavibacteria bacterium]|nr:VOC family protein [Ignavibacteria bacterium]
MATVNIYLTFNGNCEEAFNFYKSAFGGDFDYIGRFGEIPQQEAITFSDEEKKRIMHVSLPVSKETILMGSDTTSHSGDVKFGDNFSISINADSREEAVRLFNSLSAGGKITMPMKETFWGAYFGMFEDKFGVNWMVNHDVQQEAD